MPPRSIPMTLLPPLLLLARAGCPLAGEWPAKSAEAPDAATNASTSAETGSSGTEGDTDGGSSATTSTGDVICAESECLTECITCITDADCAALRDCVDCTDKPCVNNCRCELGTTLNGARLFKDWAACRITNYTPCAQEREACTGMDACATLFWCIDECGNTQICPLSCIDACMQQSPPEGVAQFEAWEQCVNESSGFMTQ